MSSDNKTDKSRAIAEWELTEPTPLFNTGGETEPRPKFVNPVVENAIMAISRVTGAPEPIAMQSVLAALSLATQGLADVRKLHGTAPVSLFFLTIAKSGERKTTCDNISTAVLRELEKKRAHQYRRKSAAYENWQRDGEVIEGDGPPNLSRPVDPRIFFSDLTVEGLIKHFENGNPSVAIVSSEAGQFFQGHSMKSENRVKTGATYSRVWDDGYLDRHRATSGSLTLWGRRMTMHLMVQPGIAAEALADRQLIDQGFYSRVLIAFPSSNIGKRLINSIEENRAIKDEAENYLEPYDARLLELIECSFITDSEDTIALKPIILELAAEAEQRLINFHDRCEIAQGPEGIFEHIQGFASKCPEHACRLAGILTIFENSDATEVSEISMANAIEIIEWYLGEMLRLRECGYVSPDMRDANKLLIWLLSKQAGQDITVRDIMRFGPRPADDAVTTTRLLAILESHGWVYRLPRNTLVKGVRARFAWRVRSNDAA